MSVTWDKQFEDSLHGQDNVKLENQPTGFLMSKDEENSIHQRVQSPSLLPRLARYASKTLRGQHVNRPMLSDLIWTFTFSFIAIFALGTLSSISHMLPGQLAAWHQKGLPILLGSFGTLTVLLFARPESEPVKVWNLVVGEVLCVSLAILVLQSLSHLSVPLAISRALSMALAVIGMMWTDSVHPPGGALVLVASDCPVASSMGGWLTVYPSLVLTILIMLPLGVACNHLKKSCQFDFPTNERDLSDIGDGGLRLTQQ